MNCEIYVFTLFLNCVFYFLLIFFAVHKICVQTHDFFFIFLVCLIFDMKHFVYKFFRVFSHKKTQKKYISCSCYCLCIPNNSCDLYYVFFFLLLWEFSRWVNMTSPRLDKYKQYFLGHVNKVYQSLFFTIHKGPTPISKSHLKNCFAIHF